MHFPQNMEIIYIFYGQYNKGEAHAREDRDRLQECRCKQDFPLKPGGALHHRRTSNQARPHDQWEEERRDRGRVRLGKRTTGLQDSGSASDQPRCCRVLHAVPVERPHQARGAASSLVGKPIRGNSIAKSWLRMRVSSFF